MVKARTPALRPDIDRFLADARASAPAVRAGQPARVLFALDATASREPTWDLAMSLHAELFQAATQSPRAGVTVQLAYYRGFNEFHASPWSASAKALLAQMTGVRCLGGLTQIGRVLAHALAESRQRRIKALVFVGDACEEKHDMLANAAGKLGVVNLPCFVFQEGHDTLAARVFRDIARLSGGVHAPFAPGSAEQLRTLFGAVAAYAAHGRRGIERVDHDIVRGMLAQLPP